VIAKSKYVRAGKGAQSAIREHLRYVQERERGQGESERKFFDRERQGIERQDVYEKMLEGRGQRVGMHTVILSPGDNNVDLVDYTRQSMEALEGRLGHSLDWYAVVHENTEHHHAHVVIAGQQPGREHDLERQEARQPRGQDGRWTNEEKEMRELVGHRYDERAETDPREERREERSRWGGRRDEREETDPAVRDLVGDNMRSPAELKTEKMLDKYERQMAAQEEGKQRGDVYIDRGDLKELRDAGNDYLTRERSLERELDQAIEREMSRDLFTMEHQREHDRGDADRSSGRGRDDEERDRDDGLDRGR
jgi:type IV secretory pathway VirD2 relaxase